VAKAFALQLTPDEQLVLYHFLLRYTTRHEYEPEDAGEDAVLDKVCLALCDAAGVRPAVESPNYDELVVAARERVYLARRRSTDDA
jgi:hypothetical protein